MKLFKDEADLKNSVLLEFKAGQMVPRWLGYVAYWDDRKPVKKLVSKFGADGIVVAHEGKIYLVAHTGNIQTAILMITYRNTVFTFGQCFGRRARRKIQAKTRDYGFIAYPYAPTTKMVFVVTAGVDDRISEFNQALSSEQPENQDNRLTLMKHPFTG